MRENHQEAKYRMLLFQTKKEYKQQMGRGEWSSQVMPLIDRRFNLKLLRKDQI